MLTARTSAWVIRDIFLAIALPDVFVLISQKSARVTDGTTQADGLAMVTARDANNKSIEIITANHRAVRIL